MTTQSVSAITMTQQIARAIAKAGRLYEGCTAGVGTDDGNGPVHAHEPAAMSQVLLDEGFVLARRA